MSDFEQQMIPQGEIDTVHVTDNGNIAVSYSMPQEFTADGGSDTTTDDTNSEPTEQDIILPDKTDVTGIYNTLLLISHPPFEGKRGIPTMCKRLKSYLTHARLLDVSWDNVQQSVRFVNGERSIGQLTGDRKRSVRSVAENFYSTLPEAALRMQCQLFNVDYDSSVNLPEGGLVELLVQKHLAMVEPQE